MTATSNLYRPCTETTTCPTCGGPATSELRYGGGRGTVCVVTCPACIANNPQDAPSAPETGDSATKDALALRIVPNPDDPHTYHVLDDAGRVIVDGETLTICERFVEARAGSEHVFLTHFMQYGNYGPARPFTIGIADSGTVVIEDDSDHTVTRHEAGSPAAAAFAALLLPGSQSAQHRPASVIQ